MSVKSKNKMIDKNQSKKVLVPKRPMVIKCISHRFSSHFKFILSITV